MKDPDFFVDMSNVTMSMPYEPPKAADSFRPPETVVAKPKVIRGRWDLTFGCRKCYRTHHHDGGPAWEPPAFGMFASWCKARHAPKFFILVAKDDTP